MVHLAHLAQLLYMIKFNFNNTGYMYKKIVHFTFYIIIPQIMNGYNRALRDIKPESGGHVLVYFLRQYIEGASNYLHSTHLEQKVLSGSLKGSLEWYCGGTPKGFFQAPFTRVLWK